MTGLFSNANSRIRKLDLIVALENDSHDTVYNLLHTKNTSRSRGKIYSALSCSAQ